jgi:hypothetical protein
MTGQLLRRVREQLARLIRSAAIESGVPVLRVWAAVLGAAGGLLRVEAVGSWIQLLACVDRVRLLLASRCLDLVRSHSALLVVQVAQAMCDVSVLPELTAGWRSLIKRLGLGTVDCRVFSSTLGVACTSLIPPPKLRSIRVGGLRAVRSSLPLCIHLYITHNE